MNIEAIQAIFNWMSTMKSSQTSSTTHMRLYLKRILVGFAVILLGLIVFLYLALPIGMGVYAVLPGRETVSGIPEGYKQVTLATDDGVKLKAWYLPPENGTAIILIHGAGASRESLRPYAEMLARQGYGVLALDLRGHGDSEGKINSIRRNMRSG